MGFDVIVPVEEVVLMQCGSFGPMTLDNFDAPNFWVGNVEFPLSTKVYQLKFHEAKRNMS